MRLLLVRHGLAIGQTGRAVGRTDLPLAPEGREAIERLGRSIGERPGSIVSSDLERARESAAILAARWDRPVTIDPRLRELDFGLWENRAWAELEASDHERLSAWMQDWARARTPDGESFETLAARVGAWIAEARGWASERQPVLVVGHAGSIRAILCHAHGVSLDRAFSFPVDHATLTEVELA